MVTNTEYWYILSMKFTLEVLKTHTRTNKYSLSYIY